MLDEKLIYTSLPASSQPVATQGKFPGREVRDWRMVPATQSELLHVMQLAPGKVWLNDVTRQADLRQLFPSRESSRSGCITGSWRHFKAKARLVLGYLSVQASFAICDVSFVIQSVGKFW